MIRRSRGLTLIELLVVIAIVAFLSTFLIANLARSARQSALTAATLGTVKQCELALTAYRSEFGQFPPDLKTLLSPRQRTITAGDASDPRSTRVVTFPPFLVVAKELISLDGKDILDAWGDPLQYDPGRAKGLVWSQHLTGS